MLKRLLLLSAVCLIFPNAVYAAAPEADYNWQLLFQYDSGSLTLLKADRIISSDKRIHRPGYHSAPLRLDYQFTWTDQAGQVIHSSEEPLPLGYRTTPVDGEPCRTVVPDEGVILVRVSGPTVGQSAASLNLSQPRVARQAASTTLPTLFEQSSWTFPIPSASTAAPEAGPLSVTKIRDTGPDDNRLVVAILGDGYTAANLTAGDFELHAAGLGDDIAAKSPWDILFEATNLYRIDVESNEQGADNEVFGVLKDTYLHSSFWTGGVERSLALNTTGYLRSFAAADAYIGPGVWDVILVLVNSTKYGGTGGTIAVSSVNSSASEIVIHELGHTFGNLADEYESAIPGTVPADYEANVDFDYDGPGLKWLVWVEPGTPLPTPEISAYNDVVGTFEGARYFETGIYRPWNSCEMRSLNRQFCPVCKEAHIKEFADLMSWADFVTPTAGGSFDVDWPGVAFNAAVLPFDEFTFEWSLDGDPIPGATGATLNLTPAHMSAGTMTLELRILLATDLVRKYSLDETYSWTVTSSGGGVCCTGIVGDANYNGDYEPTIGDISTLVDFLFLTQTPLICLEEGDTNQSGGPSPTEDDVTIGDISLLVDYLFLDGDPLGNCF